MDNALLKTIRKSVASVSLLALLSTFVSTSAFADTAWPFADAMPANAEVAAAATSAFTAGYMTGDGMVGGPFNAEGVFNRAQAAKVFTLAYFGEDQVVAATAKPFPDVEMGQWYTDYVNTVKALGVMTGNGDGTFAPSANLQQEQVAVMVYRVLAVDVMTKDVELTGTSASDWWYEAAATLYNWSILDTDNFVPGRAATRGWVVVAVERSGNPVERGGEEPTPSDEGAVLTVELSEDSAMAGTVPSGSSSVAMASFDFTASYGDVNIEKLVVKKGGISEFSDSTVTLWNGTERLTAEVSINSTTDRATFNNVDVMVQSGETATLTVRMNVEDRSVETGNSEGSAEVSFMVEDVDAVDAGDAEVQGDFPVEGDMMSVSTTTVGTVVVDASSTISNPFVGEDDVKIAQFTVEANANAGLVRQLGLYQGGTIDSEVVQNLRLFATGEEEPVATAEGFVDDLATFVFADSYTTDATDEKCAGKMGYCVAKNASKTFYVMADLNTGEAGDTLSIYVDETFDVLVEDARYGYNMGVNIAGYDGTTGNVSSSTLQGGEITITNQRLTDREVSVDSDEVELMRFSVSAENDVTFREFGLGMAASLTTPDSMDLDYYTDIKVSAVDGSITYGPIDSGDFTAGEYTFSDDFDIEAGETIEFVVTADIEDYAALAGETVTMSVLIDDGTNFPEVKDAENNRVDVGDDFAPSSDVEGDEVRFEVSSLEVNESSLVDADTYVLGASNVSVVAFSFTAGDSEDMKVTDLNLQGYYDLDNDVETSDDTDGNDDKATFKDVVRNMNLYVGSVAEANKVNRGAQSADSAGLIEFSNLNWTVPAGETKELILTADLVTNTSYDGDTFKVTIVDQDDVIVTDEEGDDITPEAFTTHNGTADMATGEVMTLAETGTLTVEVADETPETEIVVAGTSANEFAVFKFTADVEDFTVEEFTLVNQDATSDDAVQSVSVRYFTNAAQTTEATASCPRTSPTNYRCNLTTPMYVPNANSSVHTVEEAYATVEVALAEINTIGADDNRGETPEFGLDLSGDLTAYGVDSNEELNGADLTETGDVEADTNAMVVRATDIALTAVSTSQTGVPDASEDVMNLTLTANSKKAAKLDAGLMIEDGTLSTSTVVDIDGEAYTDASADGGDADTVIGDAAGELASLDFSDSNLSDDYAFTSLWVYVTETATVNVTTDGGTEPFDLTADTWTMVTIEDTTATLLVEDTTATAKTIYVDQVIQYTNFFNVDLSLPSEEWASVEPTLAYLKRGSTVLAEGYTYLVKTGTRGTGQILFVPTETYSTVTFTGASALSVLMDTTSAITNDSDETESLQATVQFGNSTTAGDISWNDQGDSTAANYVVDFFGVSTTDKVTVTTRY